MTVTAPPIALFVTRHAAMGIVITPMPPTDESAMPPPAAWRGGNSRANAITS